MASTGGSKTNNPQQLTHQTKRPARLQAGAGEEPIMDEKNQVQAWYWVESIPNVHDRMDATPMYARTRREAEIEARECGWIYGRPEFLTRMEAKKLRHPTVKHRIPSTFLTGDNHVIITHYGTTVSWCIAGEAREYLYQTDEYAADCVENALAAAREMTEHNDEEFNEEYSVLDELYSTGHVRYIAK